MQIDVHAELQAFEFYLRTETDLCAGSIRRAKVALKPLLEGNVITDKKTFQDHCLARLDAGIDPYTVNKEIAALKHYLDMKGEDWGRIKYFKVIKKNQLSPSPDEVRAFLQVHTTPVFDMYWLIHVTCGTRPSEVLNLRRRDIDLNNSCFYPEQTKTDDGKPIVLLPFVKRKLEEYLVDIKHRDDFLFPSKFCPGQPLTLKAVEIDCQERLKQIGCSTPYTPNSFRHAYITIGLAAGVPLQYIQRSARHAQVETTMGYLDKNVDYAKQAAYAHPYNRDAMSTDEIIAGWIKVISESADARFDKAKLQEAYAALYRATIFADPPPKENNPWQEYIEKEKLIKKQCAMLEQNSHMLINNLYNRIIGMPADDENLDKWLQFTELDLASLNSILSI